jgi:hypothetical protein
MSCCGRSFLPSSSNPSSGRIHGLPDGPALVAGASAAAPSDPWMQYVGQSALTVTGPVTGRTYRFAAPGASLAVNRHDAASLLYVPTLKPVRR